MTDDAAFRTETADALAAAAIDGFCAGAPWGEVAARRDGRTAATSYAIWNHGMERFWPCVNGSAKENLCGYVGLPAELLLTSLPGAAAQRAAGARGEADVSVFFANAANLPWRSHARWFLGQMQRWGYVKADVDRGAAAAIFRPDLFVAAARALALPVPKRESKEEGNHAAAWRLAASPKPIPMGPDLFMDGARFAPADFEKC